MPTLNLNDRLTYPLVRSAQPSLVYTRATWSAAWTLRPDLHPEQSVSSAAPALSTATLRYYFGTVLLPGASAPATYVPITGYGYFVLIRWLADGGGYVDWLGYAEAPVTRYGNPGITGHPTGGEQTVPCYGLERALQLAPIVDTVYELGGSAVRSGVALPFNRDGRPNRSPAVVNVAGDTTGTDTYVFAAHDATAPAYWSTRDIVQYLLKHHLPTPNGTASGLPWQLLSPTVLPDWDRPVVEAEGRSVWDLLNERIDHRQLLGWNVEFTVTTADPPTDPPTVNTLSVRPYSLAAAALTLTGHSFAANPTIHTVTFDQDPLTTGLVSEDSLEVVDQVIVRGPRQISVCTLSTDAGRNELVPAWAPADETTYEDGAKNDVGWAALKPYEQHERNATVRANKKLHQVFRRFKLADNWTGKVDATEDVFIVDGVDPDPDTLYLPYFRALDILQDLPLYEEVDYGGNPVGINETAGRKRRPVLFAFERPWAAGLWMQAELLGDAAAGQSVRRPNSISWSAHVKVIEGKQAIEIDAVGAPQHAVAGDAFTGNDGDQGEKFGGWHMRKAQCTLALQDDRRTEARHPETVSATADVIRRRVFYLGEGYERIRILPATVVGYTSTGDVITSDGGYLRDPSDEIKSVAKLLYEHHGTPRRSLTLNTSRRLSSFKVGELIGSVGDSAPGPINSPITRIEISAPLTTDDSTPVTPTQTILAAAQPIDLLVLLQKPAPPPID